MGLTKIVIRGAPPAQSEETSTSKSRANALTVITGAFRFGQIIARF